MVFMHLRKILHLMFSCRSFWIKYRTRRVLLTFFFYPHSHFLDNLKYLCYFQLLSVETMKIWDNAYNQSSNVVVLFSSASPRLPPAHCIGISFQNLFIFLCKVKWYGSFHMWALKINLFIPSCFLGVLWTFIEKAR